MSNSSTPLKDLLEHHDMMGVAVHAVLVQAQRMPAGGDELCLGHRIAAREQGDLVALPDELLRQVGHHPLRPAIVFRRHAFVQRRNLGNFHRLVSGEAPPDPSLAGSIFAPSWATCKP